MTARETLDALTAMSRQLGELQAREAAVSQQLTDLENVIHRGNGREALTARIMRQEDRTAGISNTIDKIERKVDTLSADLAGKIEEVRLIVAARASSVTDPTTAEIARQNTDLISIVKVGLEKAVVPVMAAAGAYLMARWGV